VDDPERRVTEEFGGHGIGADPAAQPGSTPINRRKSKKIADAERRERRRLAEERIEAERAQRRADNRATRERDASERAERQRAADAARERARQEDAERLRRQAAEYSRGASHSSPEGARSVPTGTDNEAGQEAARRAATDAAKEAARERKRRAEAERRAARAERSRRQAEEKAARRREKEEARRAEREAVHARSRGADPYLILGVTPHATAEEVARAYRQLARAHHPDLNQGGTLKERAAREAEMKRVNVAYGLLSDPQRRKAYDRLHRRS
jgi:hypothetical protein